MEHYTKRLAFLFPFFAFFAPISGILILMICLIVADTISGIWKSKKLNVPITSWGFSAIVNKIILYCGAILLFFALDKLILNEIVITLFSVPFITTKLVSLVFCSIELFSIDENFKSVKGFGFWQQAKKLISTAKLVKEEAEQFKNK